MKNISPKVHSLGHAVLVFLYISLVAWILSNGASIFGQEEPKSLWVPVMMLLIFVISATIVGTLVLGRPILLYLDGKKKDAVTFLFYTVGWVILIAVIVFLFHPWR